MPNFEIVHFEFKDALNEDGSGRVAVTAAEATVLVSGATRVAVSSGIAVILDVDGTVLLGFGGEMLLALAAAVRLSVGVGEDAVVADFALSVAAVLEMAKLDQEPSSPRQCSILLESP